MFNTLKKFYRPSNIYSMDSLSKVLSKENDDNVVIHRLDEFAEMKDWDSFFSKFYPKLRSNISDNHIFSCSKDDIVNNKIVMKIREADLEDGKMTQVSMCKRGFHREFETNLEGQPKRFRDVNHAIQCRPELMRETEIEKIVPPGMNEYKQVGIFTKYIIGWSCTQNHQKM